MGNRQLNLGSIWEKECSQLCKIIIGDTKRSDWWYDEKELKIWKYLNSKPMEELLTKYADDHREMVEKYGNIYFYKPIPKLVNFHRDPSSVIITHGNNRSGKSYGEGADLSYMITGKSPFREFKVPPLSTDQR